MTNRPIVHLHDDFWDGFHPDHRSDLLKSGLTVATVQTAGIYSARPGDIQKLLGYTTKSLESAMVFPYPNDPRFCRIKVFPVPTEPHAPRYLQRRQSGVRLYIPPLAAEAMKDPAIPLSWTEGEKKALLACQEGIPCIALGGLWNWIEENRGVAGLGDIAHPNRLEHFYPDADVWARPDLLKAVYAFLRELEACGAQADVGVLPATAGVQKLDEFLQQRPPEALQNLQHLTRRHKTFSGLAKWWQGWRNKKLGTPAAGKTKGRNNSWICNAQNRVMSCQHNSLLWLAEQGYDTQITFDSFKQLILVNGEPLSDELVIDMVRQIEAARMVRWSEAHMRSALVSLGSRAAASSLTTWLDTLTWDGKHRILDFFTTMYGTQSSEYTSACAQVMFLSAVARAYQPGCQADVMVVLIGAQGIGKSKGIAELVPDVTWYTDDLGGDLYDKKAGEGLQGKWLIEFGEFVRINRATSDVVKSFISRRVDHYRPPYGHIPKDFPRQCIFVGTTNNPAPLQDLENRRFMPVRCPRAVGDIASQREQLWAEAVHLYRQGEPWWITDQALLEEVKEHQEDARQHDEWESILRQELRLLHEVTLTDAAGRLGITKDRLDKSTQMRVAQALSAIGYARVARGRRDAAGNRAPTWSHLDKV